MARSRRMTVVIAAVCVAALVLSACSESGNGEVPNGLYDVVHATADGQDIRWIDGPGAVTMTFQSARNQEMWVTLAYACGGESARFTRDGEILTPIPGSGMVELIGCLHIDADGTVSGVDRLPVSPLQSPITYSWVAGPEGQEDLLLSASALRLTLRARPPG